jgi:hypothetical protein
MYGQRFTDSGGVSVDFIRIDGSQGPELDAPSAMTSEVLVACYFQVGTLDAENAPSARAIMCLKSLPTTQYGHHLGIEPFIAH